MCTDFVGVDEDASTAEFITVHQHIGSVLCDLTSKETSAIRLYDAGVLDILLHICDSPNGIVQCRAAGAIGNLAMCDVLRPHLRTVHVHSTLTKLASSQHVQTKFAASHALALLSGPVCPHAIQVMSSRMKASGDGKVFRNDSDELQTVVLSPQGGPILSAGIAYFEVQVLARKEVRIGLIEAHSNLALPRDGLGSNLSSWGVDLYFQRKRHGDYSRFGRKLKENDIIGVLFADRCLRYTLNGRDLGIAFENVESRWGLFPALSLSPQQQVFVNFGQEPFSFAPSNMEIEPLC